MIIDNNLKDQALLSLLDPGANFTINDVDLEHLNGEGEIKCFTQEEGHKSKQNYRSQQPENNQELRYKNTSSKVDSELVPESEEMESSDHVSKTVPPSWETFSTSNNPNGNAFNKKNQEVQKH